MFPSPVREDGPGWRAEVDLPYGVTAAMVTERREQLASGLRRPLGAVWPEPVTSEHAGRLELWVGRQDVGQVHGRRRGRWPAAGRPTSSSPIPFGTDVRGRVVKAPLIYGNWLLGSIPRQGKTAAVRVLACGVALDPLAEMWVHELKGSGDLDPLERVSHRFVSGVDDAVDRLRGRVAAAAARRGDAPHRAAQGAAPRAVPGQARRPGRSPPSAA